MKYNFKNLFLKNDSFFKEFIETYTSYFFGEEEQEHIIVIGYYEAIFTSLVDEFEDQELFKLFENLAKHQIASDTPYIIITNELNNLKTFLIKQLNPDSLSNNIVALLALCEQINNRIAFAYLQEYIKKLKSINNLRIASLSEVMDKNILIHYESHLLWLSELAKCIEARSQENFPELDANLCDFGKWLQTEGKSLISNNSKFKSISALHSNLHLFAHKIYSIMLSQEHHIITTYLEKCEMLSLSIGTELALIDNILMNHKVLKDPLTGALNRQGLGNIFKNQYELSLATSNPFVFAMCDLDNFKKLNDNYGHLFGDEVLKSFVSTVKSKTRSSDIIMRYGGEEFILMLAAASKEEALHVLEKIRAEFHQIEFTHKEERVICSVSIGFVEIRPNLHYKPHFLEDYIGVADQKLYSAKKAGKNRIEYCC